MRGPKAPEAFHRRFQRRQIVDLHNAGKPKREAMDEYGLARAPRRGGSSR